MEIACGAGAGRNAAKDAAAAAAAARQCGVHLCRAGGGVNKLAHNQHTTLSLNLPPLILANAAAITDCHCTQHTATRFSPQRPSHVRASSLLANQLDRPFLHTRPNVQNTPVEAGPAMNHLAAVVPFAWVLTDICLSVYFRAAACCEGCFCCSAIVWPYKLAVDRTRMYGVLHDVCYPWCLRSIVAAFARTPARFSARGYRSCVALLSNWIA